MHSFTCSSRSSAYGVFIALVMFGAGASVASGQTFSNSTQIRIPGSGNGPGPASPFPSNIVVSGLTRPVGDVTVEIVGLTHTFPADVGILLVGPAGQTVVLMANAGVNCDVVNVQLTFADGASPLPTDCITSDTYSPTGLGNPTFDAPAPAPPYGNALSLFSGTNGNGTWSLFVIDDALLDSGLIAGGWTITFTNPQITYQGRLLKNGVPVNAHADFVFSLFDVPTGGAALEAVALNNVDVTNGLFMVELPLDVSQFDDTSRWLEILVRSPAGSGFFALLSNRQPLDSTPLALHSRTAGLATAAIMSANATHADAATQASLATHASIADSADTATFATNAGHADTADLATAATRLDTPDGSPTSAVFVSNNGEVGIPIATAGNKLSVFGNAHVTGNVALGPNLLAGLALLHVQNGSSTATPQPEAAVLVEGNASSYINILARDSSEHGVSFGSPTSNVHGGIYYTNSVGMDFRTGNDLSRMTINAAGNVGIGVGVSGGSIDAKLHVFGSSASNRPLKVDRQGSDGELIAFARDDSVVGSITVASGVVSYNAFTGSHWAWLDEPLERGMLVSMTGENRRSGRNANEGEVIYGVRITSTANDPACLGAYLAADESLRDEVPFRRHQIMSVGNGEIWVVNTGRDIHPGDYLIASDIPGCAMLDDPTRFPVGNVIAKAAEVVDWRDVSTASDGVQRYRMSVLFDSFARSGISVNAPPANDASVNAAPANERLQARIRVLEMQNKELIERFDEIEQRLAPAVQPK